jgi:LuxR family maltose regulon positive regulatory protein
MHRIVATSAALRAADGAPKTATQSFERAGQPPSAENTLVLAAAELARGDTGPASETISAVLRQADLPLDVRVDAWLLSASCELVQGRTELARTALDRALRLAEPEKLRRPVIETSPGLRRFLRQENDLMDRHEWLGAAIVRLPGARQRSVPTIASGSVLIVEPLTAKEQEVLRHLAALFSTEEIARKMFVSVNTVKTHVRGVLRKLSASRRNEAIRRARELGLV